MFGSGLHFFKIYPSSGDGVQSVTGLNTNNADPLNPIVMISIGTGLSGSGTPGDPLICTAGGENIEETLIIGDDAAGQSIQNLNSILNGTGSFLLQASLAKIDDATHTAQLGINKAASPGYNVDILGNIRTSAGIVTPLVNSADVAGLSLSNGGGTEIVIVQATGLINLIAANGVTTSAGLTVGTVLEIVDATTTITQPAADQMLLTASAGVKVTGGFGSTAIATKNADYTLTSADHTILIDGQSNTVTIEAGGTVFDGQIFFVKATNIDFAAAVNNVDNATYTFAGLNDSIIIQWDATAGWFQLIAEYK